MPHEINWSRDFDAALRSAGNNLVLLDFSAAPLDGSLVVRIGVRGQGKDAKG